MPSIRNHKVLSIAGEGSYGVVLKCKNMNTGKIVAIKQFKGTEDETTVREMKILKLLKHKNIVHMVKMKINLFITYIITHFYTHFIMYIYTYIFI